MRVEETVAVVVRICSKLEVASGSPAKMVAVVTSEPEAAENR